MNALRSALAALLFLSGFIAASPAVAQGQGQASKAAGITVPVTGTSSTGATFDGEFTIQRFVATDAGVVAVGLAKGIVTMADGKKISLVSTAASGPVSKGVAGSGAAITQQQAACEILNLVLGPLHLDLLGLVIDLNQVVLNITAVPGAGNLLGNLLCAIVGLLDGTSGGALTQLANLLNQLLGILS